MNWFNTKELKSRQTGLASLETALLMPVFLTIVLLVFHSTVVIITKMQVMDEARLQAWSHAFGMSADNDSQVVLALINERKLAISGHPIFVSSKSTTAKRSEEFIRDMRSAGERAGRESRSASLTAILDTQHDGISLGDAKSFYFGHPWLEEWLFLIESSHSVVARRIWERRDFTVGYDGYLNRRLNSNYLFRGFFPCPAGRLIDAAEGKCQ